MGNYPRQTSLVSVRKKLHCHKIKVKPQLFLLIIRKGIKGEGAGVSEEMAAGCGWVQMVGRMAQISTAANDQVFAVGADDRLVYHRTGVCSEDLTGKRWRALHAPLQVSRASSNASLNRDKFHRSLNTLVTNIWLPTNM